MPDTELIWFAAALDCKFSAHCSLVSGFDKEDLPKLLPK